MDRYKAAIVLAQLILEQRPTNDALLVAQALDDLRHELVAGRANQQEAQTRLRDTFRNLYRNKPAAGDGFSVKAGPPALFLIEGGPR